MNMHFAQIHRDGCVACDQAPEWITEREKGRGGVGGGGGVRGNKQANCCVILYDTKHFFLTVFYE